MEVAMVQAVVDTRKLSDMIVASFEDGWNLVGKGKMFIKDEAEVASRVRGVKWGAVYLVKFLFGSNE